MAKGQKTVKVLDKQLTIKPPKKNTKVDIAEAVKQRCKGYSLQEIGDNQGVTKQAIDQALAPYKEHISKLAIYRGNRDSLQDMAASKCLEALLTKDMESEKASSVAAAFKVFNDASRLERGESTSNVKLAVIDLGKYQGE